MEPVEENYRRALLDQVEAGIDYPVLPQLRDFVDMFLEPLAGQGVLGREAGGYVAAGDFGEAEPAVPPEYLVAADVAREAGVPYRVAVTGPFTLASSIAAPGGRPGDMFSSILGDRELFAGFLGYMRGLGRVLARELRPRMICLDEPVLSVIVGARRIMFGFEPGEIGGALDAVLGSMAGVELRGVHVCSRLPTLLKGVLLGLGNAVFLDHEHSDISANRAFYARGDLERAGKYLGYGVVSSRRPVVEGLEEVYGLAREAAERYGDRLLFLKPDCGFRGLAGARGGREYEEIVLPKIRVLVEAARRLGGG